MNHIFILAGSKQQADYWRRENNQRDARYVDSPEDLRGIRNAMLVLYGTYWQHPRELEIRDAAKLCGFTVLTEAGFKAAEIKHVVETLTTGVPYYIRPKLAPGTAMVVDKDKPTVYVLADSVETLHRIVAEANRTNAVAGEAQLFGPNHRQRGVK